MEQKTTAFHRQTIDERAKGTGHPAPSVSSPAIHYTTTVDARAFLHADTAAFIAYNRSFTKRILSPLQPGSGMSLHVPRPLYLEDEDSSKEQISLADLLVKAFENEDFSIHIMQEKANFMSDSYKWAELQTLHKEFTELAGKLPRQPLHIGFWGPPPLPAGWPAGMPRMLKVTADTSDEKGNKPGKWPVALNGDWITSIH